MATTQTFGGGVHPHEIGNGKNATNSQPIVNAAAPARVTIAMSQHLGAPAACCVKVGDVVNMGQVIGEAQGAISAPVHASVSGKVVAVSTCVLASGKSVPAVVIDNDYEDRWDESVKACENVDALSAQDIVDIARSCGVVGLGGATFPTAVKLNTASLDPKPDTLVINGSECEPYLTSDHRLMVECAEQIIDGIRFAMKATGVSCAKVGIENNKPDAIEAMKAAATDGIEIVALPAKYPQGYEKMLIYALTGRRVPNGKLPSAVQCIVMNVATCASLSDAVRKGQPVIDRIVTVAGRVANPCNLRVRIGVPLLDVIDQVGGMTDGVRKLICGGPMMGKTMSTLNTPITKNFSAFLPLGEESVSAEESACIRCGRCMRACPMGLMPAKMDALVRHGDYAGAIALGALNCMECGSCTYSCPAKRELLQAIKVAKCIGGNIKA
ncbi:MAG: electron transport complex subunit RsxC [Clostridia bacterium]|nr:electron transport complex subunit RsxC [Clostridia bacterium]MBQ4609603.1 electron transport complex subunit RsxC [Clostridia bacterium]MBQ7052161.1 electron transport complex subunit RsxC [Clostridia bacterium]